MWPLLARKSGLHGHLSTTIFCAFVLLLVSPFGWRAYVNGPTVTWTSLLYMFGAGLLSAVGLLLFNSMLIEVKTAAIGGLMAVILLMQLAAPVAYQAWHAGKLSPGHSLGLLLAVGAIFLLRPR
jgi:hypothetical protein